MDESAAAYPPDSPEARVSDATTYFGLDLMRAISFQADTRETAGKTKAVILGQLQPQQDKTVMSPLSMQTLLNIILLGAADQSLSQAKLAKVLGYGDETKCRDREEDAESASARLAWAHEAMHNVLDSVIKASLLPSTHELELGASQLIFTLKNLILSNKDIFDVDQEYLSTLDRYYSEILCTKQCSRHEPLTNDCLGEQLNLRQFVNLWVKEVTDGQMKGSADEFSLSKSSLRLELVSATHFKTHWLHAFDPNLTQDGTFFINSQYLSRVNVKYMRQTGLFGYVQVMHGQIRCSKPDCQPYKSRVNVFGRLCCQALSLPLSAGNGQELSMVVLVPIGFFTLGHLIENLTVRGLNQIYRHLHEHWVEVKLPKFTIEASHDAGPILSKLGLSHLFGNDSELDPIRVPEKDYAAVHVRVDKIIQMAKVEVNEQGAGGGGASTAPVARAANVDLAKEKPKAKFNVNCPFLFIIRHNRSNMPLFIGQVSSLPDAPAVDEEVAAPPDSSMTVDYEPDTPDARISQATSRFGLNLMKAISSTTNTNDTARATNLEREQLHRENTIVSPLWLEIDFKTILLPAADHRLSQAKLAEMLGPGKETECWKEDVDSASLRYPAWTYGSLSSIVMSIMRVRHVRMKYKFTLKSLMLNNNDKNPIPLERLKTNYPKVLSLKQFSCQYPLTTSSADGQQLNFRESVNMWVRERTNNQITGLPSNWSGLSEKSPTLAFVNVFLFTADWLHAFDSSQTQDRTFYNRGHFENGVTTKFMCQTGLFGYVDLIQGQILDESDFLTPPNLFKRTSVLNRLNCQVLSLPFSAGDGQENLSMVILLPNSPVILDELFEELTAQGLDMLYRTLTERLVSVQLPKFSIEASHDAEPILSKLGVTQIFSADAELDAMQARDEDFTPSIDKIMQMTKIEVDELGVGAAAPLMASISRASSISLDEETPEIQFVANRPFLFIICHNRSGMPLLMGQVTNFAQA